MRRLTIHIKPESGYWLVYSTFPTEHGTGKTPQKALIDYWECLEDRYNDLVSSESELGTHLAIELAYLKQLFTATRSIEERVAALETAVAGLAR